MCCWNLWQRNTGHEQRPHDSMEMKRRRVWVSDYHKKVLLIKFSLACTLRDSIHSLKTIKTIWQKVKDKQPTESTAHDLSFKGSQRRVLTTHPNVRTICTASLTAPCKTTKTSLLRWFFSLYRVEGQWKISWLYVHQGSERLNAPTWWWARLHLFRGCC